MTDLTGTLDADTLTGTSGNDTILGLGGNDFLDGLGGNDNLFGGDGNDYLSGGDGDDFLDPGAGFNYVDAGIGNDTIDLSKHTPADSSFVLLHNSLSGRISDYGITVIIDGDNNFGYVEKAWVGSTTLINVANALALGPALWGGMFVDGTEGDDEFFVDPGEGGWLEVNLGNGYDNIVIGDGGGFVRLNYAAATRGVVANLGLGLVIDDGFGPSNATQPSFLQTYDIISGFGFVNEFQASMYDDRIVGSGHDEQFILRAGNDVLLGRGGDDLVRYDRSGVGAVNVDLGAGTATGIWSGSSFSHMLKSIEDVRGSRDDGDILKGSGKDNLIDGFGGNDRLFGQRGNDDLLGGDGRDRLDGGAGDDVLQGGNGADKFIFNDKSGKDTIKDFNATNNKEDINLVAVTEIKSFQDLKSNHLGQVGTDVVIDDGVSMSITLEDVSLADLHKADFIF